MTSQTPELHAIVERLEKVERQNRRMKQAGTAFLICCIAALVMGQTSPQNRTVEAEKFVLRDKGGNERGALFVNDDGPGLVLADANGNARVMLSVDEFSTGFILYDATGTDQVRLFASSTNGPSLLLCDARGNRRADLHVYGDKGDPNKGVPGLKLYDANGKVSFQVP